MARDTAAFLRMMNETNQRIAETEAAEQAAVKNMIGDPVRVALDQERREKWGQLRAREHISKRPINARHVFKSYI